MGRALHFKSRKEVECRPGFDSSYLITKENYGGLIGDYSFPEDDRVPCQLQRKQKHCNRVHGEGWVARIKGDREREGYIGGDCAQKYFKAGSQFARDRARARLEIQVDDLLERVRAAQSDHDIPRRVETLLEELRLVHDATKQLIEVLPGSVVNHVRRMAKAGGTEVMIEIRYEEPAENPGDKPTVTWQPMSIGSIRGTAALNTASLRAIGDEARAVKAAWDERQLSRDTHVKTLQANAQALESLPSVEVKVTTAAETWDAFRGRANLDRCAYLTRDENEQRGVLKASRPGASNKEISETWRSAYRAIVASIDNRSFRIP